MVSQSADQRKAVKDDAENDDFHKAVKYFLIWRFRGVFVVLAFFLLMLVFYLMKVEKQNAIESADLNEGSAYENSAITEVEGEKETETRKIDFQPVVEAWAESVGGNRSVLIYDLDRGETVGEYNPTEDYNTASLYKLFVVYEGYRRVNSGEWDRNAAVGTTGYSILECLDLTIRESYSPCAETLWAMIGHDELDEIIEKDFKITGSDISSLVSNPEDILRMLQIFYEHAEITDAKLIARMEDSFLNQPATTYNWRQGLPSGFSEAKVYNKVGWDYNPDGGYWDIYHDAAIIEFPEEGRHFIVVVMTNRVSYQDIARLGKNIENAYFERQ